MSESRATALRRTEELQLKRNEGEESRRKCSVSGSGRNGTERNGREIHKRLHFGGGR